MSPIDSETRFKIGMYHASPISTDIILVLNELPADKRLIKVQQEKNSFSKIFFFKCVTRPDLSGVPLHNTKQYTSSNA